MPQRERMKPTISRKRRQRLHRLLIAALGSASLICILRMRSAASAQQAGKTHLLMPLTEPTAAFCRSLFAFTMTGYPKPVLVRIACHIHSNHNSNSSALRMTRSTLEANKQTRISPKLRGRQPGFEAGMTSPKTTLCLWWMRERWATLPSVPFHF